jgi:hypothetical protein
MSTPTREFLTQLERKRDGVVAAAECMLMEARSAGRTTLSEGEAARLSHMKRDAAGLNSEIARYRSELERVGSLPDIARPGRPPGTGRINCRPGAEVMPLDFGTEELRAAHAKVLRQEPVFLETRASNSASSLLPAQLFPVPTFPIHEGRIADHLPAFALDAPSLEYIQLNSVTGNAGIVAEGAAKPEVVLNTTKITATVQKIAGHLGLTWESIQDWDAFTASATTELQREVIDEENAMILSQLNTTGILTHAATAAPTPPASSYSDIEQAIGQLRVGPALAVADLLVINPSSWSAIRRQTNTLGNFLIGDVATDPTDRVWGVPVVETTAVADGEAWLLDTTKFGRLAVREPMSMRIGYSGTDFVQNVLRYVAEERCVLTVERPSAVLHMTTLPTVLEAKSKK